MLLDDLFKHLNRFVSLVCQDKTGGQFLSRVRVVRLQFKNTQIKRNRFLQLLGRSVVIGYVLEHVRIISRIFRRSFENLVSLFQFVGLWLRIGLEENGDVKFSKAYPEIWI